MDATRPQQRGTIEVRRLTKEFADKRAVDEVDLRMAGGEFFSLLGPSGCGKTTTLNIIAGFEEPTSGEVLLDGADLLRTPPHKRPVNTVFQDYALFPHMSVLDNVAFGLRRRGDSRGEARAAAAQALDMVRLGTLAARRPGQLSGGEQQRVALARALVLRPSVLLLDEPLGALDANIREHLRSELKELQREVGITFVFVTHDQEEALSLSDRLAVMNQGRVEQVGTPREVYETPATTFVADFVGTGNLLDVDVRPTAAGGAEVRVGEVTLRVEDGDVGAAGPGVLVMRPERLTVRPRRSTREANCLPGIAEETVYVGAALQIVVRLVGGAQIQASVANAGHETPVFASGEPVSVHVPPSAARVLSGPRHAP